MNENMYNKFARKLLEDTKENEEILKKACVCELQEFGNKVDLEYIKAIFKSAANVLKIDNLENKKIAVAYNGSIEITIQMFLFALKNNLHITLCAENCHVINNCFITLILESMKDSNIKNIYIDYDEKYNENYLKETQKNYNNIIYIGEPFEYDKFKYFINKEVLYWNYKYYKVYIDETKYKTEYKEMMKYAYMENIFIEQYNDKEEFIEEVLEIDKVIVYTDSEEEKNEFCEKLKSKQIIFNDFPYDDTFKINDLMVKLV